MRVRSWFAAGAAVTTVLLGSAPPAAVAAPVPPAVESEDEQAPPGYYPPAPPIGIYRAFSLTVAAGPGALFGPGERDLALSHNLLRVGFGLGLDLSLVLGLEGAAAGSVNPATGASSTLRQDTLSVGLQHHLSPWLYYRGSAGLGFISEVTERRTFSGGQGFALSAALGCEALHWPRSAVGFELAASNVVYRVESWRTIGLHLVAALF
jgi:hypothetical protein